MAGLSKQDRNKLIRFLTLWRKRTEETTPVSRRLPEEIKTPYFLRVMKTVIPGFNYELLRASLADPVISRWLDSQSVNRDTMKLNSLAAGELPDTGAEDLAPDTDAIDDLTDAETPAATDEITDLDSEAGADETDLSDFKAPAVQEPTEDQKLVRRRDVVMSMAERARKRLKST